MFLRGCPSMRQFGSGRDTEPGVDVADVGSDRFDASAQGLGDLGAGCPHRGVPRDLALGRGEKTIERAVQGSRGPDRTEPYPPQTALGPAKLKSRAVERTIDRTTCARDAKEDGQSSCACPVAQKALCARIGGEDRASRVDGQASFGFDARTSGPVEEGPELPRQLRERRAPGASPGIRTRRTENAEVGGNLDAVGTEKAKLWTDHIARRRERPRPPSAGWGGLMQAPRVGSAKVGQRTAGELAQQRLGRGRVSSPNHQAAADGAALCVGAEVRDGHCMAKPRFYQGLCELDSIEARPHAFDKAAVSPIGFGFHGDGSESMCRASRESAVIVVPSEPIYTVG